MVLVISEADKVYVRTIVKNRNYKALMEGWSAQTGQHIIVIHSHEGIVRKIPVRLPNIPKPPKQKGRFTITGSNFPKDTRGGILDWKCGVFVGNDSIKRILGIL